MMHTPRPNASSTSTAHLDQHARATGRTTSRALLVVVAALAVVAAACGGQDDAAAHAGQFGFDGDRTARVVEDVTVTVGNDGGGGDVLVVGNERDEPVVVVTAFSEVPVDDDEARWIAARSRTEPGMAFDQAPVQSAAGVVVEAGDHIDVVTPVEVGAATWCLAVLDPRGSGVASQLPTGQPLTTGTTVDIAMVVDADGTGDGDLVHDLACGP